MSTRTNVSCFDRRACYPLFSFLSKTVESFSLDLSSWPKITTTTTTTGRCWHQEIHPDIIWCVICLCVCVCEWICVLSICLCLLFDKRQTLRALISTVMLDDHIRQLLSAYWPRPFGGLVSFFSWLDRHSSTTISLRPVLIQYRQR